MFPELRQELEDADGPGSLWLELVYAFSKQGALLETSSASDGAHSRHVSSVVCFRTVV